MLMAGIQSQNAWRRKRNRLLFHLRRLSVAAIRSRSLVDRACAAASARSVRDKLARSRASLSAVHRLVPRFVCRWRAVAPASSVGTKSSDSCIYLRELSGKVSKQRLPDQRFRFTRARDPDCRRPSRNSADQPIETLVTGEPDYLV